MLDKLMQDLTDEVANDLAAEVEIIEQDVLDADELCSAIPRWYATDEVVAVFCDLKNSTRLGIHQHAKSSARTYEAATGGAVQAMAAFDPAFMDIQGDGVYALFSGDVRYERALCAAVTVRTWSEQTLVPELNKQFGAGFPETGFKTGMAVSRILGKRVGVRGTHEPVWAGKAVNYSAKLAQEADRHEIHVTKQIYRYFQNNDYVRLSCGCGSPNGKPTRLWTPGTSSKLPSGQNAVYYLRSGWCGTHGDEYCTAICAGETDRDFPARAA